MTAQPNLSSTAITNLDATPALRPTAGQAGGLSTVMRVIDVVGPTTDTDTTGGILRCCRIPSNAIVQRVVINQKAATTTASFDVGIDYSDLHKSYVAGSPLNDDIFAAAVDTHSQGPLAWLDVTFLNSDYLPTDTVFPIWKASGTALTQDPGGEFDIILTNRATVSGAATLVVMVDYVIAAQ